MVLAAVLGATLLGESLGLAAWFGVALIACGAVILASA